MPHKPLHPCSKPGCPALTARRFCAAHATAHEQARGSARSRGYDSQWQKVRAIHLMSEPCCRMCAEKNITTVATEVDHIIPIVERPDLRLADSNLRSLCKSCHSSRTASDQHAARLQEAC